MRVIGIDPAPSKGNVWFDGDRFNSDQTRSSLKRYLSDCAGTTVLICWDAPLTSGNLADIDAKGVFSRRIIERFFSREKEFKPPQGISVQGYSGCQHWAITQHLLGYPELYLNSIIKEKPFQLAFKRADVMQPGSYVTEVHPALAIWLWLQEYNRDEYCSKDYFELIYKGQKKSLKAIAVIKSLLVDCLDCECPDDLTSDDHIDAWVAWKLGELWVNQDATHPVIILGNEDTGSFLLPNVFDIEIKFKKYVKGC